jgi:hypothetical protein
MQNCVDEILLTSRFFPNERKCIVPSVLGAGVQLFETGPLIPMSEDEYVAAAVAVAFRESGMVVEENFDAIESFEKTPTGVPMTFSKDGRWNSTEANSASRRQRGLPSIIHVRPQH